MQITVKQTNDKELRRSLQRLAAVHDKDLPAIVRQSARRVCVNLARMTAPFGFSNRAYVSVARTITTDVSRVYKTIPTISKDLEPEQRRALAHLVANATPGVVSKFLRSVGVDMEYRKTAPERILTAKRNRMTGRVPRSSRAEVAIPSASRGKLLKKLVSRIGRAKGGWAECARQLGGIRGIENTRWVTKRRPGTGRVQSQRGRHGIFFAMTNLVPYVSRLLSATGQRNAISREKNFLEQEYQRHVRRAWK